MSDGQKLHRLINELTQAPDYEYRKDLQDVVATLKSIAGDSLNVSTGDIRAGQNVVVGKNNVLKTINNYGVSPEAMSILQQILTLLSPDELPDIGPQQLGEVANYSAKELGALARKHMPFVEQRVEDLQTVTLTQLILGQFDTALDNAKTLTEQRPTHAYGWYLLALATIGGVRPYSLRRQQALDAQHAATQALDCDKSQAHYAVLLAFLKIDYFQRKGFRIHNPSINMCIQYANKGQTYTSELRSLVNLVPNISSIFHK